MPDVTFKLEKRGYETAAVRDLRELLPRHRRVLAVSPTGSGKTVIASLLIQQEPRFKKVLFVAHRHELVSQAFDTLTHLGLTVGVLMASDEALNGTDRVDPSARVQVCSVQTLDRRGVPPNVDLVVFDEAHRAMADSYQRVAAACPRACVLGITATPCRLDGRGLGQFFKRMLVVSTPSALYASGYLAKPRVYSSPAGVLDVLRVALKQVKTRKGDYAPDTLARAVDNGYLIGKVVSEAVRLAPDVPKLVFACNVEHSQKIARNFRRAGIKAEHVDGETPLAERQRILAALRDGDIEVVCNVDVLSEGWDLPALGAVVLARPTKSLARLLQWCGRVQRPYRGRVPVIIDHGANVQRLDVHPAEDVEWSLELGVKPEGEDLDPRIKVCPACLACIPMACATCPACDEPCRLHADRKKRKEIKAKLEEVSARQLVAARERVMAAAEKHGAPAGWAERVLAEMRA
jgi:superfamily II DNA or RNA helicase